MKRSIIAAAAIAAAVVLPAASRADPVKIRVGWVAAPGELPSIMEFKKDVAKHWGQSYSFEAIHFQGTPPMMTAMAANQVELTPLSYSTLGLGIINAGMTDLTVIADEIRDGVPGWRTNEFMVLKDGPIKTVADLKGRTVAVTSAGSLTDWLVRELARQQGWGPDGIKSLPMGALRTKMAALKGGEIDSVLLTSGSVYEFEEQGQARVIASFGDLVHDFHTHVLYAPDRLVASNEALVRRFLEGWLRSVAWMRAHKSEGVKIAARTLEIGATAASKAFDQDMKMMSEDGAFSRRAIEVIRRSLVELGILDKIPDANLLYTDRFVAVRD